MKRFQLFFAIAMIASVALAGAPKRLTKSELLGAHSEQAAKTHPVTKPQFGTSLKNKASTHSHPEVEYHLTGKDGYVPVRNAEDEENYNLITPPSNLHTSTYKANCYSYDYMEYQNYEVQVGFDGNDVYIQGLLKLAPEAWIKGTRDGSQYVFELGQYLGKVTHMFYGRDKGTFDTWLAALDNWGPYGNLVLNYDAEKDSFRVPVGMTTLFYNDRNMGFLDAIDYLVLTNASAYDNVSYDLITPPTRLVYEPAEGTYLSSVTNVENTFTAFIGIDGDDFYINGLVLDLPGTWIKGTLADDGTVTFKKGQYLGKYQYVFDMWFMGITPETESMCDVKAKWDAQTHTLTFDDTTWILVNSDPVRLNYLEVMSQTVVGPLPEGRSLILPPAGIAKRSYAATVSSLKYYEYANGKYNVNIAQQGSDVYVQGLYYFSPLTWIKGKKSGNVITFDKNQNIGYVLGHDTFVLSCDEDQNVLSSFSFTYDSDADAYTSNALICFTGEPDDASSFEIITDVRLESWGDVIPYNTDVITTAPEGDVITYKRKGGAYYTYMDFLVDGNQNGNIIELTMARDGKTVYMQDPISMAKTEEPTWVKGELRADGKIHIPLYQCVLYSPESQYGIAIAQFVKDIVDGEETYVLDRDAKEVTFSISTDGVISLDGFDAGGKGMPEKLYGLAYTDDDSWSGFGDYASRYIVFDDVANALPVGVETHEWALLYNDGVYDSNKIVKISDISTPGKVYIQGLFDENPNAVITGNLSDNVLTITSDQYMGMYNELTIFCTGATYEPYILHDTETGEDYNMFRYRYLPEISFNLDRENKILTTTEGNALVLNSGEGVDYFIPYQVAHDPRFSLIQTTSPATPADPEVLGFSDWYDGYGYNMISFNVKSEDVDGNYLDADQLYYIVWVKENGDNHPYTFTANYYYSFEQQGIESLTEIPYNFVSWDDADWEDISVGGSTIVLYEAGFEDYGVQSVYYGGNERHESNIVWLVGEVDAVKKNVINSKTSVLFDLNGRRITEPVRGINIVRMSDGNVRKLSVK